MEYIFYFILFYFILFYFILIVYFKHNGMSSTKVNYAF